MDAAVNPEVAAAEKAEAARKEELRKEQVKALAVSTTSSSSLPASMLSLLGKQMLHTTFGCSCTHSMVTIGSSRVSMLKHCLECFIMLLACQSSLSCLCSVVPQPVHELLCYCHPACGNISLAEVLIERSMC